MPARCSGEKLRQQMAAAKMTTTKLIQQSGVSESTIRRILANAEYKTNDSTLQLLAEALQCSPFDLLRDEAITDVVKVEANLAVSEVVAEAVMDAVTVVTDSIAPDASQETIANAVPEMQVTPPPALDIPSYIKYIEASTSAHVEALRESRDTWRRTSVILFVLILAMIAYFLWEMFNPDKGLTSLLWQIYSCRQLPLTPAPTPPT